MIIRITDLSLVLLGLGRPGAAQRRRLTYARLNSAMEARRLRQASGSDPANADN